MDFDLLQNAENFYFFILARDFIKLLKYVTDPGSNGIPIYEFKKKL